MSSNIGGWVAGANGRDRWDAIDSILLDPSAGQSKQAPVFPGFEGLPFRGQPPNRKENDPENRQPQVGAIVHVDVLELSNEVHRKRLAEIWQLVANGYAMVSKEDPQYDEQLKNWRVFIRWSELYTYDPQRGHMHGNTGNTHQGNGNVYQGVR